MSDVLEKPKVTSTDEGDHDRFRHYVNKADWARGYMEGTPIVALCGKVWVPHHDPDKYPTCPACLEVFDAIAE